MNLSYSTNIVIFGGGIAGLWLLNRMQSEGYDSILFETKSLGGRQTLDSQGIIHGGLKYALRGSVGRDSQNIANMPNRWRQCLSGDGEIDLTDVSVLNENYYMWSDGGMKSRLKSYLGSKSLRGRIDIVEKEHYPIFFSESSLKGTLYKLPDFVINTVSLLNKLVSTTNDRLFSLTDCDYKFFSEDPSLKQKLQVSVKDKTVNIDADLFIFCAGEGNQELINNAGLSKIETQARPLHMVYLRKQNLPEIYVHCIGNDFNLNPSVTVTSHRAQNGDIIWYLGGDIAESGITKSKSEQIKATQELIRNTFPWLNLSDAQWESFYVNRAEADVHSSFRPDDAVVKEDKNILVAWPTKLTLVPSLADKVSEHAARARKGFLEKNIPTAELQTIFEKPSLARARWD